MTLVMIAVNSCSSGDNITNVGKGEIKIEGWAGPPESPNKKPYDYFYMKKAARANEKAIENKSGAMMEKTCIDAATTSIKDELIGRVIGDIAIGEFNSSDDDSIEQNVIRNFMGKNQSINTKECKPIAQANDDSPFSEWRECECIIFVKVEGGRDTILAKAQETDKKN